MKNIKLAIKVAWPNGDITDAFYFSTLHPDGVFKFTFRWFNDRWNCWVELPNGDIRDAGVIPGVVSWVGFLDYGILFNTSLAEIDKDSLFTTELLILTWE